MKTYFFNLMPWPNLNSQVAWPYPNAAFDPKEGARLYQNYIDQFVLAEDLGYDAICFNEHHFTAYGLMPSPNIMAAALAVKTSRIKLAIFGNAIPLRGHPLRIAEEIAMLDCLSGGRVICGFVRGLPAEYFAYNVDPGESRARFEEAWELITKAWTEDKPFDWNGRFSTYRNVSIWPRPLQKPYPPLWMPSQSAESIEFAARKRIPTARVYSSTSGMKESFDYYREVARREGWTPTAEYFMPMRHIYVAETDEQARLESETHLAYFYDKLLLGWHLRPVNQEAAAKGYVSERAYSYTSTGKAVDKKQRWSHFSFDAFEQDGDIIVGSPETVVQKIREQQAVLGFGTLIGLFQFGSLPHELTVKNLKLFGEHVLPRIRRL